MWIGNLASQKDKALNLTWVNNPTRILGIFVSCDSQGNNENNYDLKIQKLETNLDMWKARDLTLFGKVLIILRCTQLLTRIVPRRSRTKCPRSTFLNFYGTKKKETN